MTEVLVFLYMLGVGGTAGFISHTISADPGLRGRFSDEPFHLMVVVFLHAIFWPLSWLLIATRMVKRAYKEVRDGSQARP